MPPSKEPPKVPGKDIWSIIKEIKAAESKKPPENAPEAPIESTLFFLGSKGAGKSSLILRFLDRDEAPTPTTGLEYTFARRTRGVSGVKDVAHIWELAGGTSLASLISIPLNETNIHTTTFVIVVDLSNPAEAIATLPALLSNIQTASAAILDGLEARGSKRPKTLKALAWKRYNALEPSDRDYLTPSPVPVIIIGTHFDVFRDLESETRKILTRILRYLAHVHGASLLFTSLSDASTQSKARLALTSHAFKTGGIKTMVADATRPLAIPAGWDDFAHIGPPRGGGGGGAQSDVVGAKKVAVAPWRVWEEVGKEAFPPVEQVVKKRVEGEKFKEEAVDSMRAQKNLELEKLQRANARKAATAAASNAMGVPAGQIKRKEKASRALAGGAEGSTGILAQ
ncbi:Cytoplasmic dynein 2 light intermediate chain 1 [Geranomyces variabilis]|nr:Cytoplasmic dynein 2 light intermediate chain 1 [Geranomyces variabilis]